MAVPPKLIQIYVDFCKFFFFPGSSHEVNVTATTRRKILTAMFGPNYSAMVSAANNNNNGPMQIEPFTTTVFDQAADEILDLLYRDTFKRFVSIRAKQQQQQQQQPSKSLEFERTPSGSNSNSNSTGILNFPQLMRTKSKTEGTAFRESNDSDLSDTSKKPSFWKRGATITKSKSSDDPQVMMVHYPSPSNSPSPNSSPMNSRQNSMTSSSHSQLPGWSPFGNSNSSNGNEAEPPVPRLPRKKSFFGTSRPTSPSPKTSIDAERPPPVPFMSALSISTHSNSAQQQHPAPKSPGAALKSFLLSVAGGNSNDSNADSIPPLPPVPAEHLRRKASPGIPANAVADGAESRALQAAEDEGTDGDMLLMKKMSAETGKEKKKWGFFSK
jgi:hypothetical protein